MRYNFQLTEGIRRLTYILVALTIGLILLTIILSRH